MNVVILQQLLFDHLSMMLFSIVHYVYIILLTTSDICFTLPLGIDLHSNFLNWLFLLYHLSRPTLLRPESLCEIRHKSQKISATTTLVEDLERKTALIGDSCEESCVVNLDRHVPDMLMSFLSPGVVGTLLVKVEARFIYEDDFAFSSRLCKMTW